MSIPNPRNTSTSTSILGNFSFEFRYAQASKAARLYLKSGLPEQMTVEQVALILQINPESIRRWENKGLIQAIRVKKGKRSDRRFNKNEVLRVLDEGLLNRVK